MKPVNAAYYAGTQNSKMQHSSLPSGIYTKTVPFLWIVSDSPEIIRSHIHTTLQVLGWYCWTSTTLHLRLSRIWSLYGRGTQAWNSNLFTATSQKHAWNYACEVVCRRGMVANCKAFTALKMIHFPPPLQKSFPTIDFLPTFLNEDGRTRGKRLSKLYYRFWRYSTLPKTVVLESQYLQSYADLIQILA